MIISAFDIFKIGIGPSSSHTVGPMLAALKFARFLESESLLCEVSRIRVELYGSLGATGRGHGTDRAILLGLSGYSPDTIDPDIIDTILESIEGSASIRVLNHTEIHWTKNNDIKFLRKCLPFHANGMKFMAYDQDDGVLSEQIFYSIGGGFILNEAEINTRQEEQIVKVTFPFKTADELLNLCRIHSLSVSEIMLANERHWRNPHEIRQQLLQIWAAMQHCVKRGFQQQGTLPGGLKVKRRAADLYQQLNDEHHLKKTNVPIGTLDWVNLFALSVSEENAAGGRVVTAPTNGAAGIIPAVMHYYWQFCHGADEEGIIRFLLTAAAIGFLYKENASLSGAEVGCQGEIGVACSMAAGGLAEVLGGTPEQVENAAEIGMEHNLGLTCDPIGGLVQVPCIERNAMGAVKAINAARIALRGDGTHFVSLDHVIKTMRLTGADMKTKYKETSRGGLAVNFPEC